MTNFQNFNNEKWEEEICLAHFNWRQFCDTGCQWFRKGGGCPNSIDKEKYEFLLSSQREEIEIKVRKEEVDNWIGKKKKWQNEVIEAGKKALETTKNDNSAFMYMKNEKGEIEDWTLPVSQVIYILNQLKNKSL